MRAILLLPARLILFALFQAIIALVIRSWAGSEKYWLLTATLGNLVCIGLLTAFYRSEGKKFISIFRFSKATWRKDMLIFAGLALLCGPIAFAPSYFLGMALWTDAETPYKLMFQPIHPFFVYFLLFVFPLTIAFAELATYFGYIMPKLKEHFQNNFLAVLLPVIFLSIQHCTLPLVFDLKFVLYRGLMYFPFALLIGISLYKRPNLFPYFVIMHGLMDLGTVIVLLKA